MSSYLKQSTEKFVCYIAWDQQKLNFIAIGGALMVFVQLLSGVNLESWVSIVYLLILVYFVKQASNILNSYYKRQLQQIVKDISSSKEATNDIDTDLRSYSKINRQVSIYQQIIITYLILSIWAFVLQLVLSQDYSNSLYMILECASVWLIIFFTFISRTHFFASFGPSENSLPQQIVVIQGAIFVLALVFWKFITQNQESSLVSFIVLIYLCILAFSCSFSFLRFGSTSRKSFAYFMIGTLFMFLQEVLKQIVLAQKHPINDLKAIGSLLYYMSCYLIITGIFLHIKAYLDNTFIELRVKYSEILEEVKKKQQRNKILNNSYMQLREIDETQ